MKLDLAWHLVGNRLRDGRPIPPNGEWLIHDGPIKMYVSGLHASARLIDALQYSPGDTICRVAVNDIARRGSDKLVARRRVILWRIDGDVLRAFARKAALSVVHLWDAPEVVLRYLKTGDETLRNTANAAAWAAASDAASDAARAAARGAAWDAAWAAACGAASDATSDATRGAAMAAAWAKFNRQITRMVRQAAGNPDDKALLRALSRAERNHSCP